MCICVLFGLSLKWRHLSWWSLNEERMDGKERIKTENQLYERLDPGNCSGWVAHHCRHCHRRWIWRHRELLLMVVLNGDRVKHSSIGTVLKLNIVNIDTAASSSRTSTTTIGVSYRSRWTLSSSPQFLFFHSTVLTKCNFQFNVLLYYINIKHRHAFLFNDDLQFSSII